MLNGIKKQKNKKNPNQTMHSAAIKAGSDDLGFHNKRKKKPKLFHFVIIICPWLLCAE